MRERPRAALVLLTILVLASACTPTLVAADAPPADGKALYAKKCAMCHGADGVAKPTGKGSANLNDPAWQTKATDEEIAGVIVHGKNKMPKNDKLTPEQVAAIVAYVRSLK